MRIACGWAPCRGGDAELTLPRLGSGRSCRTAVGGRGLGGRRRSRTRTGPSIDGLGAGVVDGVMICGWRGIACVVSKGG
jgi:hypothetical protein